MTARVHTVKDGVARIEDVVHDLWLLAEQDCDLDQTDQHDPAKLFELRAVRNHGGDIPSGITGARVRIDGTRCLNAMDLMTKVSASWLTSNVDNIVEVDADTRREIKTWLGYRYDRPAVPQQFVEAHKRIEKLARSERAIRVEGVSQAKWSRLDMGKVRDLFVTYEEATANGKVRAYISAVAKEATDVHLLQGWVERIRDAVRADEALIIVETDAMDTDGATLSLLERGFSIYADIHSLDKATEPDEADN